MQCQYRYPHGAMRESQCRAMAQGCQFCERHTPKAPYQVEFEDFLEDVCKIDPRKVPTTLYQNCFDELKNYCKYGGTTSREDLMNAVSVHLVNKIWRGLDENQSELDPYTAE